MIVIAQDVLAANRDRAIQILKLEHLFLVLGDWAGVVDDTLHIRVHIVKVAIDAHNELLLF